MKVIRDVNQTSNGLTRIITFTREGESKPYYMQIVQFDEVSGFTRMWFDSNGHNEKFKITQIGVNKKNEPIWQVDYIDSTVVWHIDGKKYLDKKSYKEAEMQQSLDWMKREMELDLEGTLESILRAEIAKEMEISSYTWEEIVADCSPRKA